LWRRAAEKKALLYQVVVPDLERVRYRNPEPVPVMFMCRDGFDRQKPKNFHSIASSVRAIQTTTGIVRLSSTGERSSVRPAMTDTTTA
jgi:hypothetical protein